MITSPSAPVVSSAASTTGSAPPWGKLQFGTMQIGDTSYPLHSAEWTRPFDQLAGVTNLRDAVDAVRDLRRTYDGFGKLRTETAIMQAEDGSFWASSPLNTYWKHDTPWWFPVGEGMSVHRKETIDAATLLRAPKAQVTSGHDALRAIVGDRFAAVFEGASKGATVAAARLR